jgi:hypothetical protein
MIRRSNIKFGTQTASSVTPSARSRGMGSGRVLFYFGISISANRRASIIHSRSNELASLFGATTSQRAYIAKRWVTTGRSNAFRDALLESFKYRDVAARKSPNWIEFTSITPAIVSLKPLSTSIRPSRTFKCVTKVSATSLLGDHKLASLLSKRYPVRSISPGHANIRPAAAFVVAHIEFLLSV